MCSRVKRVEARADVKSAAAKVSCACESRTPVSGTRLTRPALETHGTVGTAVSCAMAREVGGAKGLCCLCGMPRKPVRSQVENGAVNGAMTSAMSHEATNLEIISVWEAILADVVATLAPRCIGGRARESSDFREIASGVAMLTAHTFVV